MAYNLTPMYFDINILFVFGQVCGGLHVYVWVYGCVGVYGLGLHLVLCDRKLKWSVWNKRMFVFLIYTDLKSDSCQVQWLMKLTFNSLQFPKSLVKELKMEAIILSIEGRK